MNETIISGSFSQINSVRNFSLIFIRLIPQYNFSVFNALIRLFKVHMKSTNSLIIAIKFQ